MLRSHKIALQPNHKQSTYFKQACGVARFTYNWALAEWNRQYKAGLRPSQLALRRQLNAIKKEQFPWMLAVSKNVPQMAIIHLGIAFSNFFRDSKKPQKDRVFHYPRFRKKGKHDSFTITNDQFRVERSKIRIPKLGWVRMREEVRFSGKVMSATIARTANRWFVSLLVETEDIPAPCESQAVVGVDLGINRLATLSTGEFIEGKKPYTHLFNRMRRLQRSLSRKQKGSSNRRKAREKLARIHARIANIRNDQIHKLTTDLSQRFRVVAIEDLNVKGMMKNHKLARSIGDMGFHEFRRQVEYKTAMRGGRVLVADRWFPSSKTCSECGTKEADMPLNRRTWKCSHCGQQWDRDLNAALNLGQLAVSSTVTACGESVRPTTL